MSKLGSYPSNRYYHSWITQRLANRAPEWTLLRTFPFSVGQQLLNPIGKSIQETIQMLTEERYNNFVSTANINLLSKLYKLELPKGLEFSYTEDNAGEYIYAPPTVYATIDGTEYEITIAENNDINTLAYNVLPSRAEDSGNVVSYESVLEETLVSAIPSASINDVPINGHLYVTVKNNTIWEYRRFNNIYYPKIYITGTTRKGTEVKEAIPVRYNGTFKTVNQWQSVESLFVSYMDSDATIAIESLPFSREDQIDNINIGVTALYGEKLRFYKLGSQSFGSTLQIKAFSALNMNHVRQGFDDKDILCELELVDSSDANVSLNDLYVRPYSRFAFGIDDTKLYVYDTNCPYPYLSDLSEQSDSATTEIFVDRHYFVRNESVTLTVKNLDETKVPKQYRWHVVDPEDNEYYIESDGSFISTTFSGWNQNLDWESYIWNVPALEVSLTKNGEYAFTLECYYSDAEDPSNNYSTKVKTLVFVPFIQPEVEFTLPTDLQDCTKIAFDSDGKLQLYKSDNLYETNLFYDYFLVDYDKKRIWLKESYSSVRVVV